MKWTIGCLASSQCFLLSGLTHCAGMWDTPVQYALPLTLCPSVRFEAQIPAEKTNLYLDEWRRRAEARSMYRYWYAQPCKETTLLLNPFSLSFTAKIRNWDELLSKVCVWLCVCGGDKRDTVTHWQTLQMEQGERGENKKGVEICNTDTDYHCRAQ